MDACGWKLSNHVRLTFDPTDHSLLCPWDSQAGTLEWVATPPPRDLSHPGIKLVSLASPSLADRFFIISHLGSHAYRIMKKACLWVYPGRWLRVGTVFPVEFHSEHKPCWFELCYTPSLRHSIYHLYFYALVPQFPDAHKPSPETPSKQYFPASFWIGRDWKVLLIFL